MECSIFVPQILHEETKECRGVLFATKNDCFMCKCEKVAIPFFGKKESFPVVKDLVKTMNK